MSNGQLKSTWRDTSVYSCAHYSLKTLSSLEDTGNQVIKDVPIMNLNLSKNKHIILNFLGEGHGPDDIKNLIKYFNQTLPMSNIKVLFNSVINSPQDYRYRSFPENMVNHYGFFNHIDAVDFNSYSIKLDCKFLSLNRRSSNIRTKLIERLKEKISIDSLRYSLNSNSFTLESNKVLIDGLIDDNNQHLNNNNIFRSCLFNIINESSDQSTKLLYRSIFITEKTFKAFALRQIPIWMAVPGLVKEVKKLGFDLFDDICKNHYYDNTQDEDVRCGQVVKLCKELDNQFSIDQCQKLRKNIWNRLELNYNLLKKYITNSQKTINNHFEFLQS